MSEEVETTNLVPPTEGLETPPTEPKVEEPKVEEPKVVEPLTAESVKLPEGFEAHEETLGSFLEIMNNGELAPGERAQALVDLQAKVLTAASEANSQAWEQQQDQWQTETKADPEVGGPRFQETLASVGKLVDQYGSPELREVFDVTGAGNNVHVVKFLAKIAGQLTEGTHVSGTPAPTSVSLAEKMFSSTKGS